MSDGHIGGPADARRAAGRRWGGRAGPFDYVAKPGLQAAMAAALERRLATQGKLSALPTPHPARVWR